MYLNEKPVNIHEIPEEVARRFKSAKKVYVRADKDTIFDPVAQVISELGRGGTDAADRDPVRPDCGKAVMTQTIAIDRHLIDGTIRCEGRFWPR